jgi:hypothetical protein
MSAAEESQFDWPLCYEAEDYILGHLEGFTKRNQFARCLTERMASETGTLLIDWVDHIILPQVEQSRLHGLGFIEEVSAEVPSHLKALWQPRAMLPRVLLERTGNTKPAMDSIAIRCESIADFSVAHNVSAEREGAPLSRFRRILVAEENGARLFAIERRGYRGYVPARPCGEVEGLLMAAEAWRLRRRCFDEDGGGFGYSLALVDRMLELISPDLACHAIFSEERAFWQRRNRAGQIQKARQDRLGLGWANHDHHTFRSSREHFVDLMRILEKLGFERRERYYAGAQAGWGAQILEQPTEGIVAFCDVDLEPDETAIDFSRTPLEPSRQLGTIGLWVGLHGESFLDAGMHHLECRFDHQLLREQLVSEGVNTMKPFSDFPFLKQAFTEGEHWSVRPERAARLLKQGFIDQTQFQRFTEDGAIGSHLENLQRKGGFKGFNQKSVSAIIRATDPRSPIHAS